MDFKHIEIKLARATTLPIFPHAVTQILSLSEDASVSMRQYERIIVQDPALTAKIMRTANSPYYGGGGQITSLQRALSQLGINTVRSICVTVAFQSALGSKSLGKQFNVSDYWQHSISVACIAKVIAGIKRFPRTEEVFIAGLVHDIGKLAMALFLPEELALVQQHSHAHNVSLYETEVELLQISHQELGLRVAELWALPEAFWRPIAYHHTPMEDPKGWDHLTGMIHAANVLAHRNGMGDSAFGAPPDMDDYVDSQLGISDAQFELIASTVQKEVEKLIQHMGMPAAKAA